jgi:hypothetical protein
MARNGRTKKRSTGSARSANAASKRPASAATAPAAPNRRAKSWVIVALPVLLIALLSEGSLRAVESRWWRFSSEVGDGGVTLRKFRIATEERPTPDAMVVGASDAESAVDPAAMESPTVNAALPGLAPSLLPLWVSKLQNGGADPGTWVLGVSAHAFLDARPGAADADQIEQIDLGLESVGETLQIVDLLAERPQRPLDQLALVRNRIWTADPLAAIDRLRASDPQPPALLVNPTGANEERWQSTFEADQFQPFAAVGVGSPNLAEIERFVDLANSLGSDGRPALVVLLPTTPSFRLVDETTQNRRVREAIARGVGVDSVLDLTDTVLDDSDFSDANHFSKAGAAKISERIDERL